MILYMYRQYWDDDGEPIECWSPTKDEALEGAEHFATNQSCRISEWESIVTVYKVTMPRPNNDNVAYWLSGGRAGCHFETLQSFTIPGRDT